MKRHIDFGEIKQFRNVVRNVQDSAQYIKTEDGIAIFDRNVKFPVIKAYATEKIHGTNAAVCYSNVDGFWVQGRNSIITTEKDNAGCAFAVYANKEAWLDILIDLAIKNKIDLDRYIVSVFFEWCGGNIQKKSAVSGLDKLAIIFAHFKVSHIESSDIEQARWFETDGMDSEEDNIFNISNFDTWAFEIDFNKPQFSIDEFLKVVEVVENSSPVGNSFDKDNIGEGIVVTFKYKGGLLRFKVKGDKHANSKVKKLKPVDLVKEQKKIDFVNLVCIPIRLEQAWQTTFGIEDQNPDIKETGTFLRNVIKDIMKEETDILVEMGLEPKEVNGMISKQARTWFMEQLNTF